MSAFEQIVKLSPKKKAGILLLSMVLVAAFCWLVYLDPMQTELSGLEGRRASLEDERADANRRKATYDKDRKRRDELKKFHGQQLRALPTETEMSSFLNSLNTQAELVGLEITSVKPKKEEKEKYYARIPVHLKLSGSYHQLAKFFYLVGSLDRIINIENITLRLADFVDANPLITAEVLATTFRAVKTTDGGAGKKKVEGGS